MESLLQVRIKMFPVTVLLIFATAQALVPPLNTAASVNIQNQNTNRSNHSASFAQTTPKDNVDNGSSKLGSKAGCKNCGSNRPPSMSEEEYKMRIEVFKQQILKSLHLSEPPKIKRRDFNIPPPLLKKFQEARRRQQAKENEAKESVSEVVLFGNKFPMPKRPKRTNNGRKVKFGFHVSYKVFSISVRSAKLWVYLSPSKLARKSSILVIKEINEKDEPYVITKHLKDKEEGWVTIDVKNLVNYWKRRALKGNMRDLNQNKTLVVTCSNCDNVTGEAIGTSNITRPFIVIEMVSLTSRKKRAIDCRPGITSCCRMDMKVSFTQDIGWDWILVPSGFSLNYCTGSCYGHILPAYSHSSFLQKVALLKSKKDLAPCCSPTKLAALSILFYDPYENIIQENIENMTVQECGCS